MIAPQKKKCFRNKDDNYLTPHTLTQLLLDNISLDKGYSVLEPCSSVEKCIANVLETAGYNVTTNIYTRDDLTTNFLDWDETKKFDVCFSNTPYGDKNIIAFVSKMKKIATKKVIALYPLSILHGNNKLKHIWNDKEFALKQVYLLVRPAWLADFVREDGKYSSGMNHYAWFVWEKGYNGKPMIEWLDNSMHLISRKTFFG